MARGQARRLGRVPDYSELRCRHEAQPACPEDRTMLHVVSNHIRSLMVNHLAGVASSDQHMVKPWFNGKLDFSPKVNDLAADGLSLIAGRVDLVNDQPVAALVYRRNKHYLNLSFCPPPPCQRSK